VRKLAHHRRQILANPPSALLTVSVTTERLENNLVASCNWMVEVSRHVNVAGQYTICGNKVSKEPNGRGIEENTQVTAWNAGATTLFSKLKKSQPSD